MRNARHMVHHIILAHVCSLPRIVHGIHRIYLILTMSQHICAHTLTHVRARTCYQYSFLWGNGSYS